MVIGLLEIRILKVIIPIAFVVGALVFVPAGTFDYWQGWLFISSLFFPMVFVMLNMLKHARGLLEKRLQTKEKRKEQKLIQIINASLFLATMIIAGLDHRFAWSNVPVWLVLLADSFMLLGYLLFIRSMFYNEYASRIIELQQGQKLIDTGPYAVVRHPMYSAGILMYIFIPLVLGSFWAIIPILFLPMIIANRIFDEEIMLIQGLPGYIRYMKKARYRLIPFVW